MSRGYLVDPDALGAFAVRLDEAADEVRAVASTLEEPPGDLGPEGVTEAVGQVAAEWAAVLRGVELDALAEALRVAGETYRQADELRHD